MHNNDILIRLRYALDIKDTDMITIFKLGGIKLTKEDMMKLLIKSKDLNRSNSMDHIKENENIICDYVMMESFLNGLIIYKRGEQKPKEGVPEKTALKTMNSSNVNNIMLKKLKIALSLTSEDMLDIFKKAGVIVTKGELGAIFRKEGHRNYKECGDKYARNFLKGLAIRYRG